MIDASLLAAGAVLMQMDENSDLHPSSGKTSMLVGYIATTICYRQVHSVYTYT